MAEGFCGPVIAPNWDRAFRARDRRPIYEWAREHVFLPPRLTRSGLFNVEHSRQFIAPFDALQNHRVREVNVCAPVRDGKTLIADVWLAWLLMNNPGAFRWVFADDQQARDQAEERVKPIIRAIKELAHFVPKGEITEIAGVPVAIDGPALGNLQARGYEKMVCDEPWMWPPGRLHEAKERQKDFKKRGSNKLLCISQGGSEKCEDWKNQFHLGIIHEWHIQCQGCGKFMAPVWSGKRDDGSRWGMCWDKFKEPNGLWNAPKSATTARFECFHCGFAHVDTPLLKQRWNQTGKYLAEVSEKNDQKVSFHWNGIATYLFSELVELFLNACNQRKHGSLKALVIFFQKQMAEFATERSLMQSFQNFSTQMVEINSDWADEDARVMSIDCQMGGVFYVTARALSRRAMKIRRLFRGVVHGEAALIEKQKELKVPSNRVFIDSGWKPKGPGGVYAMCIRNGWVAVKGVGKAEGRAKSEGFWHNVDIGGGKTIRVQRTYSEPGFGDPETGVEERADLILFSSDLISDLLDGLIKSGVWEEPPNDGTPEEKDYLDQMAAEVRNEKGQWEAMSTRNHYKDCAKIVTLEAVLLDMVQDPLDNRTEAQQSN